MPQNYRQNNSDDLVVSFSELMAMLRLGILSEKKI